jgi:hypothetical protein
VHEPPPSLSKSHSNISKRPASPEEKRYARSKTTEIPNSTLEKLKRLSSSKVCHTEIMPVVDTASSARNDTTFTVESETPAKPKTPQPSLNYANQRPVMADFIN